MIWLVRLEKKIIEIPVIYKERIGVSGYTGSTIKAAILGFKMLPLSFKYKFKKI